jgi:hypothetical protein
VEKKAFLLPQVSSNITRNKAFRRLLAVIFYCGTSSSLDDSLVLPCVCGGCTPHRAAVIPAILLPQ